MEKAKEVSFKETVEFFKLYKHKMIEFEYDSFEYKTKITFPLRYQEEVIEYWQNKDYCYFTNLTLIFVQ
jgi:hypothetical protein